MKRCRYTWETDKLYNRCSRKNEVPRDYCGDKRDLKPCAIVTSRVLRYLSSSVSRRALTSCQLPNIPSTEQHLKSTDRSLHIVVVKDGTIEKVLHSDR
uniref:Uncharacterized protein n=1 Tax=Trichogramma kaykai TaxID=54128 RepID=A0ABD2XEK4_9HYME